MSILIVGATTGYQTHAFDEAAAALGIELRFATDHCERLPDLWGDHAIAVDFEDAAASIEAVKRAYGDARPDGVIGLADAPSVTAAAIAEAFELPFHPYAAARAATNKLQARGRLLAASLPVPWFVALHADEPVDAVADRVRFPCVVKPTWLSGSRGVIRADSPEALEAAVDRVRCILRQPELAAHARADAEAETLVVEGFIAGAEFALEGVLDHGMLRVFAIFEKPEPLDGPYFEETIYVTPPRLAFDLQRDVARTVAHAAAALGLRHGPVHAEVRTNAAGVYVLEVAPRPIGGLCSRSLRFVSPDGQEVSFEAVLLEHARGTSLDGYGREGLASAVLMMPVPATGYYRGVENVSEAEAVPGVKCVAVSATPGQLMRPAPEGASYLGFVFARGAQPEQAVAAVRDAHARLRFRFDKALTLALP